MVSFSDVLKFTTGELLWKNTPVGNLETGFETMCVCSRKDTVTKLYICKKT